MVTALVRKAQYIVIIQKDYPETQVYELYRLIGCRIYKGLLTPYQIGLIHLSNITFYIDNQIAERIAAWEIKK